MSSDYSRIDPVAVIGCVVLIIVMLLIVAMEFFSDDK